jgi:hypothetical protein
LCFLRQYVPAILKLNLKLKEYNIKKLKIIKTHFVLVFQGTTLMEREKREGEREERERTKERERERDSTL